MTIVREHGRIVRYQGGFWAKPDDPLEGVIKAGVGGRSSDLEKDFLYPKINVGTGTVLSLVRKGLLEITKVHSFQSGGFPVECCAKLE